MKCLIELETNSGLKYYVNPLNIQYLCIDDLGDNSMIVFTSGDRIFVKERPDELEKMLRTNVRYKANH